MLPRTTQLEVAILFALTFDPGESSCTLVLVANAGDLKKNGCQLNNKKLFCLKSFYGLLTGSAFGAMAP
jgi:hypothetical protein